MRNLQEQVKKAFCCQNLFWPFTVWINCSSNLKNFANSWPSVSNFKSFSQSLEQFFLTVGQNKIPLYKLLVCRLENEKKKHAHNFPFLNKKFLFRYLIHKIFLKLYPNCRICNPSQQLFDDLFVPFLPEFYFTFCKYILSFLCAPRFYSLYRASHKEYEKRRLYSSKSFIFVKKFTSLEKNLLSPDLTLQLNLAIVNG